MARKTRKKRPVKSAGPALRRLDETFEEWRFEPTASVRQYVGAVVMSAGGIALGAGLYEVLFGVANTKADAYGPWLIAAGLVLLLVFLIIGQSGPPVLRIGDFGIGLEEGDRVARTGWFQIKTITLSPTAVTVRTAGPAIVISRKVHAAAARRLVAEALRRIPDRTRIDEAEVKALGDPKKDPQSRVEAEPPQVTNMVCAASSKPLTFERDVRMCGRCGVFYHRSAVPARCVECERKLRKKAA